MQALADPFATVLPDSNDVDGRQALDVTKTLETNDDGYFQFADRDLEDRVVACLLAQAVRAGRYSSLRGFFSFRPIVWNDLLRLTAEEQLDIDSLLHELRTSTDSHYLRLLIDLAGHAGIEATAEPICKIVIYDGTSHSKVIEKSPTLVTPFLRVCRDALARLPASTLPIITDYKERAELKRRWHQKRIFDYVERRLKAKR